MIQLLKDLRKILPSDEKKSILLITLLIVAGTCLETLSVGLMIPGLALYSTDSNAIFHRLPDHISEYLRSWSREDLLISGMFFLAGLFFLKNFFLAFSNWFQARFASNLQMKLARQLFITYLRQPYSFHLNRNSSELIRYVNSETHSLINYVISPLLIMTSESFVIVGLLLLLVFLEPIAVIASLVFLSLAAWGLHNIIKNKLKRWGQLRLQYEISLLQQLQQGLGGVKDIKLLGRENDFLSNFASHLEAAARMNQNNRAVAELPRLWLEFFGVLGLCFMVLIMNRVLGKDIDNMVTMVGVSAVAAFRVLPSLNRITFATQALSYGRSVVVTLANECSLRTDFANHVNGTVSRPIKSCIEIQDVAFSYENSDKFALTRISMKINRGQSVGIIGPSGGGKSTLIDIILGLLKPTSGKILVDGRDIEEDIRNWQNQIGYVPQSIYLTDDSLRRNIAFGLPDSEIDDGKVEKAAKAAMLLSFVEGLPQGLDTMVGERGVRLSGGQRQRIGIARALYHDPEVLVLDEATSALDNETEKAVMDAIISLKGKKTMIVVAHRLTTVQHCDRLYRLRSGRIVSEGNLTEVSNNQEFPAESLART